MTKQNPNLLTVPSEFMIACFMYKISLQDALQIFIKYCTLYHAFKPTYCRLYSEALETIFRYLDMKRPGTNVIVDQRQEIQGFLMGILEDVVENGVNEGYAKKEVAKQVNKLIKTTSGKYYPKSRKLFLDEETPLLLTKDFCAMCELYQCHPAEILNYYMTMISVADMEARVDLKMREDNCTMFFFMGTVFNYLLKNKHLFRLTDEEDEFMQEAHEFRLYLYHIKNFPHRRALLKKFYQDHYYSIHPNELNYAN